MTATPSLPDLVGQVILEGLAGARDPLQHIAEAERLAGELTHLGERLVGFFIEQARADGLSWAEIGAPRGLSRQGAQQRYSPFFRHLTVADLVEAGALRQFGEAALAAVHRAESHAVRLGREAIDSGDLLLGVLDESRGAAAGAIRRLGVDPVALRAELERPNDSGGPAGPDPTAALDAEGRRALDAQGRRALDVEARRALGAEARRALDAAVSEARGHVVAPTHLLLGVLRNPASRAGRVLEAHGVTKSSAMGAILAVGNPQPADRG